MASTNPVPSRAAINALKGVILTTSCSVILLAEERRRRIQIARAAIDNARKLHTVRVNHGPALSESFGSREAWAELGEDLPPVLLGPESKGPIRRRRTKEGLHRRIEVSEALEHKKLSKSSQATTSTPETRQKEWDEWDATRRELTRVSASSLFAHHDLFLRVSADEETPIPPLTSQELESNEQRFKITTKIDIPTEPSKAESHTDTSSKTIDERAQVEKKTTEGFDTADALHAAFFGHNTQPQRPSDIPIEEVLTKDSEPVPDTIIALQAAFSGQDMESAKPSEVLDKAQQAPVEVSTTDSKPITTEHSLENSADSKAARNDQLKESLTELDALLSQLKMRSATVDALNRATTLLESLESSWYLERRETIARGLQLLESAARLGNHSSIPAVLDATLPACTNVLQVLAPFIQILQQNGDVEGVRQLLDYSSQSLTSKQLQEDMRARNSWVIELIGRRWKSKKNVDRIKRLYTLLQDAGLFTQRTPVSIQYAVRRQIAIIALEAGDEALVNSELECLNTLQPDAVKTDIQLGIRTMLREARLGRWDDIDRELVRLKAINGHDDAHYQKLLSKLTITYSKTHTPNEVETFARHLVTTFGMDLNRPLSFLIMDRHGRNRDVAALGHWLQFCKSHGLEMDQLFFDKIAQNCRKYWNFDEISISSLFKNLQTFIPDLKHARILAYSHDGALGTVHKRNSRPQDLDALPQLPPSTSMPVANFEQEAFRCLNVRALKQEWNQVVATYDEASAQGLGFSSRCLRLAVVANIKREGSRSQSAARLVRQAHAEGHDVSGALVPLLVAQLESGGNVDDLIHVSLSKGTRIHDSVFNKATRILAEKGHHNAAITMCKTAAKENGKDDLTYNQFNFANLIVSCAKTKRYDELANVVSSFTSKSVYWQGSKQCKESIKLAMKTTALKAEMAPEERHCHEEALLCLDEALQHVKKCRATVRDDRQALAEEVVGVFKSSRSPLGIKGQQEQQIEEAPIRNISRAKTARIGRRSFQQEKEMIPRIESQEGLNIAVAYG